MNAPLHLEVSGPAGEPIVMLVHPLAADLHFWDAQVIALSTRFRVATLDLPGHGRSPWSGGALDVEVLGRMVIDAMDSIGAEAVHYCGLSIGGMVGMWLATHHPSRLRSLVLSNCLPHLGNPQMWEGRAEAAKAGSMREIASASAARWVSPGFAQAHPSAMGRLLDSAAAMDATAYAAYCRLLGSIDIRNSLARIAVPTLVIGGTQDLATPAPACEAMAAAIPQAKFVTLHGAHFSNLECPDRYAEVLHDFFGSLRG